MPMTSVSIAFVNTLFRFEDSVLVAQEQGDEERLYSSGRLED